MGQRSDSGGVARGLLWAMFGVLFAGELATTIWWISELSFWDILIACALLALGSLLLLCMQTREQVVTIAASLILAVLPSLSSYSAVLLIFPLPVQHHVGNEAQSNWELLHMPAVLALAAMYVSSALAPVVHAECQSRLPERALSRIQCLTREFCILAAWVYLTVAFYVGVMHILAREQSTFNWWGAALASPFASNRGFMLGLHAIGFTCAEARGTLAAALGKDLLPLLVGTQRARTLTLKALVSKHWPRLLRHISMIRRCAPPQAMTAFIVTVRRTGPVLFPMVALVLQLAQSDDLDCLLLALVLTLALTGIIAAVAVKEFRALPVAPLRQLPLLLPSGVTPLSRRLIGHALSTAEQLEGTLGRLEGLRKRLVGWSYVWPRARRS